MSCWLIYWCRTIYLWNKPQWSWSMFLSYIAEFSLLIFLEYSWLYVHQAYWPIILIYCGIVWFWYQSNAGLIKWAWIFLFFQFFWKMWRIIFIRTYLTTYSISLPNHGCIQISKSSWLSLGRLHGSRNLFISSRLFSLLVYNCS